MVEVEIRTPVYDEESQEITWDRLALVRADGSELTIYGNESVVMNDPVMDVGNGEPVHMNDDLERWARNLPAAYRNGDLVAVLLRDDDAPGVDEPVLDEPEPNIPDPPMPIFQVDDQTAMSN